MSTTQGGEGWLQEDLLQRWNRLGLKKVVWQLTVLPSWVFKENSNLFITKVIKSNNGQFIFHDPPKVVIVIWEVMRYFTWQACWLKIVLSIQGGGIYWKQTCHFTRWAVFNIVRRTSVWHMSAFSMSPAAHSIRSAIECLRKKRFSQIII